jgi:RNA recognition motif-containing protein
MIKLFVGGFPLDMEELELAKLFAIHGDISTIKIVRDKKTRKCKGYAFIEMVDINGAENAVEALDQTLLKGKALSVKITEEPKPVLGFQHEKPPLNAMPLPAYTKVERLGETGKVKRPRRA